MQDDLYRRRALPPGSIRHLAWLFATPRMRDAWVGVLALQAEWRALLHAATDRNIAASKLAWWRDEMLRLTAGSAVHPICRFMAALPGAAHTDFRPLVTAIEAVALEFSGVALERAAELPVHADARYGGPLRVAAGIAAAASPEDPALVACTAAAAAGEYLVRALADHRSDARRGFVTFPVDTLLAAGIDNAELAAASISPRLERYLEERRCEASDWYARAAQALPASARPAQRGLLVLIELERRRLAARHERSTAPYTAPKEDNARPLDLWWAWRTARRAARGR